MEENIGKRIKHQIFEKVKEYYNLKYEGEIKC
jgi:hypothetical protein